MILLYLITGAVAGTLSGLLGIGGGSIIVPMLSYTFAFNGFDDSVNMHIAAMTSLCAMIFTSMSSVWAHKNQAGIDMELTWRLLPGVFVGVIFGVLLADSLPTAILRVFFGVFLLLVAMRMFLAFTIHSTRTMPSPMVTHVISVFIGINSGLLGVGGGMMTMPLLTHCNIPMRTAVGVSAVVTLMLAIVGTITGMFTGHDELIIPSWHTGYVNWPAAIAIASTSMLFAPVGAWLSHRLPVVLLKRIFATAILFAGVHMLWH